jgi:hypothetical protein
VSNPFRLANFCTACKIGLILLQKVLCFVNPWRENVAICSADASIFIDRQFDIRSNLAILSNIKLSREVSSDVSAPRRWGAA